MELTLLEKPFWWYVGAATVLVQQSRLEWHTPDTRKGILLLRSSLYLGRWHARTEKENRVGKATFDSRPDAPVFMVT